MPPSRELAFDAVTLAVAFLLGSIPFGVILASRRGVDLKKVGSGNIGATNVLRTGRKDLALITLVGDAAKGAVALLVARGGQPPAADAFKRLQNPRDTMRSFLEGMADWMASTGGLWPRETTGVDAGRRAG